MPRSRQRSQNGPRQHRRAVGHFAVPSGPPIDQRLPSQAAEAHARRGDASLAAQRWREAVEQYEQASCVDPRNAAVWLNCGVAQRMLGRLREAESCFTRALTLQPHMVEGHANLGSLRRLLGMPDQAVVSLCRAAQLRPESPEVHFNLANALSDCGRFEDARAHYRRSLELRSRRANVLYNLVQITKFGPDDVELADLEALAAEGAALSTEDRAYVGFALGKAYNDLGRYDEAFGRLAEANALVRPQFDREGHRAFIDRLIAAVPESLFKDRRTWGDSTDRLVFIVGMPRSGTTLVEQILANHPAVRGRGERREIQQLVDDLDARAVASPRYPESLARLNEATGRELAARYRAAVDVPADGVRRITDKMPTNFLHLGLIALLFPAAHIVHCCRDPRDVCLSCYQQHFERRLPYAYDLRDLAVYYSAYERLMHHWHDVLPVKICDVQYEDLVSTPEACARRLVEFCGLDWNARCLEFDCSRTPVQTASQWQVRQPLYRSSVGRWRNYRSHIGPLLEAFGNEDQVRPWRR